MIYPVLNHDQISEFHQDSVIFMKSLYSESLCEEIRSYILEHEQNIISRYLSDARGLVVECINGHSLIKYFEYPLHYNASLFGRLLNSSIFEISRLLLNEPVYFISAEIHSRFPGASEIPAHQDNAYYGLQNGKALTFYIALDDQCVESGGLQYLSNRSDLEYKHSPSRASGFSLEVADKELLDALPSLSFRFKPGDASIHHSRSIHRAMQSPSSVSRSLVMRFSLFASSDFKRPGHDDWYRNMIRINRQSS